MNRCNKITYDTFREGQHLVNLAKNKHRFYTEDGKRYNRRQTYKPKRVYKCEVCGKYHLTSKKRKK